MKKRKKAPGFLVIIILLLLGGLYYNNFDLFLEDSYPDSPVRLEKALVSKHVDGDTVYVILEDGSEKKVRFTGVNSPESTTKTEPYGKEASDYTKRILKGKTIYLEKDVSETDKYGRLLRYIWIEPPTEISESEIRTKMFNAIMVLEGYAQSSTYPPDVKYSEYFKDFQKEARENNTGLWALKNK
ncbi:MAG: hypothetical protein GX660_11485 [Clostridiaceae bacterium]|nr:hypothetical protein [Clostridiaceae bacterium]